MEKQNVWLTTNRQLIEGIKRLFLEKDLEGSYTELPLVKTYQLLVTASNEVQNLQTSLNLLENKVKSLEKELAELKKAE